MQRPGRTSRLSFWLVSMAPRTQDADAAWVTEIERRVEDVEAGTAELEPWEDVKRRIKKESLGQ
jgi:hypothetical protein